MSHSNKYHLRDQRKQHHMQPQIVRMMLGIKDPTATPEYQARLRPKTRKLTKLTRDKSTGMTLNKTDIIMSDKK